VNGTAGRDVAWLRAAPAVFVLIWSTGFIVARLGMPHGPPMTFLAWRYALSVPVFLLWIQWAGARWPRGRGQWWHLGLTGVLMHAIYLGGIWAAVKGGLSAGTAALIAGLQPLLTALWLSARGRQHAAGGREWAGLVLGLAGLALVVWHKVALAEANAVALAMALTALVSITIGTLYQKRFVHPVDVRAANAVQLMAAFVVTLPLALLEPETMRWTLESGAAMAWSVLVLTLGGSSLLVLLIQRGAATRVASLMYLVPPSSALMAWMLFDEALTAPILAGMALAAFGVWLVVRAPVR